VGKAEGESVMSIFKDIKTLFRYHATTRLLIQVADTRLNEQSIRIYHLEEKLEKLENK
jgi:hypothetical protein